MKHRPRHWAEYLLLRAFCGLAARLPYRAALLLACRRGARRLCAAALPPQREAIRRIRSVLGDACTRRQARAIAWQSLRNMAFNLAEIIYLGGGRSRPCPGPSRCRRPWTASEATCSSIPAAAPSSPAPTWATGSWPASMCLPSASTCSRSPACRKTRWCKDYLQRLRHAPGVELLERGSGATLRKVFANLRKGKFLAIMPDLRSRLPGVRVRFFGGEANLYPGMGHFARQVEVPSSWPS
jgi:lauroyl/myristoyl acyltransferase